MLKAASDHPEPTLQTTALRYAAGDLNASESAAFETLLADDQDARDALSEAVRLSAAALGQAPPTPHHTFRAAIRERLVGWCPAWLKRGAYRGHPLAWCGLGAAVVFACTIVGLSFDRGPLPAAQPTSVATPVHIPQPLPVVVGESPQPREAETFAVAVASQPACGEAPASSVAELWAQFSTPEHVEKTHDEEMRWRQKLQNGRSHTSAVDAPRDP